MFPSVGLFAHVHSSPRPIPRGERRPGARELQFTVQLYGGCILFADSQSFQTRSQRVSQSCLQKSQISERPMPKISFVLCRWEEDTLISERSGRGGTRTAGIVNTHADMRTTRASHMDSSNRAAAIISAGDGVGTAFVPGSFPSCCHSASGFPHSVSPTVAAPG